MPFPLSAATVLAPLQMLMIELARLLLWLALVMAIFVPLERRFPQRRQPVLRPQFAADLGLFFLNGLLPKLLLALPLSALAWLFHSLAHSGYFAAMAAMPMRLRFVLALVVGDAGAYWGHRLSHELPLLWRWHRVHHSAEAMDWLVNTRAHPFDLCITRLSGLVPIYLLGLAQPSAGSFDMVPILYAIIGTIWSFFVHANLGLRFGALEGLVATPAFHHWHHAVDGAVAANRNYAAMFPWIDRLFGSHWLPSRCWPERYGIPAAPALTATPAPDPAGLNLQSRK
jgi:sterol desaturase/sphingolipid hydroxylase (fatty acid hydroxylase superfamily)